MTTTASSTRSPDLVRLGVEWSGRRAELVLPARVAVAELVPALAAAVEALDPDEAHRGCALVGEDGRALDPETGLREQGVSDGQTVTLVLGLGGSSDLDDVVHDDLADAVTDALIEVSPAWDDDDSRRSSVAMGGLGLATGALLLVWHHSSGPGVGAAAAALSVILLAAGVGATRQRSVTIANLLLLAAGPYAAVAGFVAASGDAARSWLCAGLALVLAGGVAALVMTRAAAREEPTPRPPLTGTRSRAGHTARPARPLLLRAAPAVPWLIGGSFGAVVAATVLLTSLSTELVVAVELVGLVVLAVIVLRLIAPRSRDGQRVALAGVLGVDLVLAAAAPVVVTVGGWAGLALVSLAGLLLARHTRSVVVSGGGRLLTPVAIGAALAGPMLASVTALYQLPSILPSLSPLLRPGADGALPVGVTAVAFAIEVVVASMAAVVGPVLTFLRTERRSPSPPGRIGFLRTRDDVDLVVEAVVVVLLVALLAAAVGLVPSVRP